MKLYVVAGHGKGRFGRRDNGASFNGTNERDEVVEIAKELIVIMQQQGVKTEAIGVDERLTLSQKVKKVADSVWKPEDVLVSIHINSASSEAAKGVEGWYMDGNPASSDLTDWITSKVSDETGLTNRGIKPDTSNRHKRLAIVRDVPVPACLIECGFLTNEFERGMLTDPQRDDAFAIGIAKGIMAYFDKLFNEPQSPEWYSDVPMDVWYASDLKLCVDEGIFKIPSNGKFNPTPIRAEQATIMARHLRNHHNL